jgi:ABC-type polysaccharide/polyol phosphate export permease
MYLTPIFYPMAIVPERFRFVVRFNPVRSILEVFRDPIYFGKIPPLTHLGVAVAFAAAALLVGAWAFRRNSDKIPYYV